MKGLLKSDKIIIVAVSALLFILIIVACKTISFSGNGCLGLSDLASIVTIIGLFGAAAKYLISDLIET